MYAELTMMTVGYYRTGLTYEDMEADMYNYDFKDKWHASQLNTAEQWDVEKYKQDTVARDVKRNNYFCYGNTSPADKYSNDPKVSYDNIMHKTP